VDGLSLHLLMNRVCPERATAALDAYLARIVTEP
jgi:hypothetical protein